MSYFDESFVFLYGTLAILGSSINAPRSGDLARPSRVRMAKGSRVPQTMRTLKRRSLSTGADSTTREIRSPQLSSRGSDTNCETCGTHYSQSHEYGVEC